MSFGDFLCLQVIGECFAPLFSYQEECPKWTTLPLGFVSSIVFIKVASPDDDEYLGHPSWREGRGAKHSPPGHTGDILGILVPWDPKDSGISKDPRESKDSPWISGDVHDS